MDKSINVTMKTDFDKSVGIVNIIPPDMDWVILNITSKAFNTDAEKKQNQPVGNEPIVSVYKLMVFPSAGRAKSISFPVKDYSKGIPQKSVGQKIPALH